MYAFSPSLADPTDVRPIDLLGFCSYAHDYTYDSKSYVSTHLLILPRSGRVPSNNIIAAVQDATLEPTS